MRDLEKKLNYTFRNQALLEEALNHSSYANEHRAGGLRSNERLEYLDGGIEAASALIHRCLLDAEKEEVVEERRRDYKTALQELVQRQADQVLTYHMTGEAGPDHDKTFQAEVQLNGLPIGAGSGHSKKEAEQAAAKAALETLEET